MCLIRKAAVAGLFLLSGFLFISPVQADPLRSFDRIFPGFGDSQRSRAFASEGFKRSFEIN
jgi:hypothetical protein